MSKKVFKARSGAFFNDEKAQAYGEFLTNLEKKEGGVLLTASVVEAAAPGDSPIHGYFEWDDGVAAARFRLSQAVDLVSHIILVKIVDGEERQIRAFFNVDFKDEAGENKTGYVNVEVVAKSRVYRQQVIEKALREIVAWQTRYAEYKELEAIFEAVGHVQKKLFKSDARPEARA